MHIILVFMVDVLTKEQRSYNMSQIKGRNTAPELRLRKLLFKNKLKGYRLHYNLTGKPDIVFVSKKLTIFIDGCFWHKCPKCFVTPATRTKFWISKIGKNMRRDKEVSKTLRRQGWSVLRFWEHTVKSEPEKIIRKIRAKLLARNN